LSQPPLATEAAGHIDETFTIWREINGGDFVFAPRAHARARAESRNAAGGTNGLADPWLKIIEFSTKIKPVI
jgi:hypothetical protein